MKKIPYVTLLLVLFCFGCGPDQQTLSNLELADFSRQQLTDFPDCVGKFQGLVGHTAEDDLLYRCEGNIWVLRNLETLGTTRA